MPRTLNILGEDRPIELKMLAVREFKNLTGVNLLSPTNRMADIFGDSKDKDADPGLIAAFVYCALKNGNLSFEHTLDQVAANIKLSDLTLVTEMTRLYFEECTGKPFELKANEKNLSAPEPTTSGA